MSAPAVAVIDDSLTLAHFMLCHQAAVPGAAIAAACSNGDSGGDDGSGGSDSDEEMCES